jgi:hypothetical protein
LNIECLKISEIEQHIYFFIGMDDFKSVKSILKQLNVCYIDEYYYKISRLDEYSAIVINVNYIKSRGFKELLDNRIRMQKLEKIN